MRNKIPPPSDYKIIDDNPVKKDKRGYRTIFWNEYSGRWEIFCPPFKMTCVDEVHVVDIVGMCDCEWAEIGY